MGRTPLLLLPVLALVGCTRRPERPAPPDLPSHTLAFGGDIILGRRLNVAVNDEYRRTTIFGDVGRACRAADLAIGNAEGVIAGGGTFSDKGEPRPIMYRVNPNAVGALTAAGFDVVNVGNNHAGDYGPAAFAEMLDRLRQGGIDYTGGGNNPNDARTPAYVTVGDVVVAIVGVDLTNTAKYGASDQRVGTLVMNGPDDGHQGRVVRRLTNILVDARRYADLVILTPHWGENWLDEPSPLVRKLAKDLIHAGYDAILGHSAHLVQGIEVIESKPVVYDAGNMLLDYSGADPAHDGMFYTLSFTRAGVTRLVGRPLGLGETSVDFAAGDDAARVLGRLDESSRALGTTLTVSGEQVSLDLDPGGFLPRISADGPPVRPVPATVREAPHEIVLDAPPAAMKPLGVRWDTGIELLGYTQLLDELPVPKAGNILTLYWRAERPVDPGLWIHLEARGRDVGGNPTKDVDVHLPGDWLLPAETWPVGKVIVDATLLRLQSTRSGEVRFYAGLERVGVLAPLPGALALTDDLVPLGNATYRKGARGIFQSLAGTR